MKRLGIPHQAEHGEPFTAGMNLRMDIVIRRGDIRDAPNRQYREESILLNVTHVDPLAQVHLRGGSTDHDGSASSTSEARKRQHYTRPGHVSFDERSNNFATLAVEKFGRLGVEGSNFIDQLSNFIDQLVTSVEGGGKGGSMARKGVAKERLL